MAKKKTPNYCCHFCGFVSPTATGIAGHIAGKHKGCKDWRKNYAKTAQPTNKELHEKNKRKYKARKPKGTDKAEVIAVGTPKQIGNFIELPVTLRIPFSFGAITITQPE